jgi:2-phospho-L-lactate guanylyltransferase
MRVVVPFDAAAPKTRLAPVLDATERREFAERMLRDVLRAVDAAGSDDAPDVDVLSTAPLDLGDVPGTVGVEVDDRPLTVAVNDAIDETLGETGATTEREAGDDNGPLAIVMADLALATPDALARLFATDGDVVLVPGRGVGTNALVVRTPAFRVDFHGTSYLDHREAATAVGATVGTVDSFRLSTDVDEPGDLVEVLVHGTGAAADWLNDRFELVVDDAEGRVSLRRR